MSSFSDNVPQLAGPSASHRAANRFNQSWNGVFRRFDVYAKAVTAQRFAGDGTDGRDLHVAQILFSGFMRQQ